MEEVRHNFEGWGPKTPDAEDADDTRYADSNLTGTGDADDRLDYVWNFQRAPRHASAGASSDMLVDAGA